MNPSFNTMLREHLPHQAAAQRAAYAAPPVSISDKETDFAEMRRDATIAGCLDALAQAVLAKPWYMAPTRRDDAKAIAVAADIEANLRDLPIETCLENALEALVYGFVPHEITWQYNNRCFRLERLGDLAPEQIAFDLDDHMNIVRIHSKPTGFPPKTVPRDKIWLFRHRASRQYPAGRSVLEAVHRAWNAKNHLLRFWGTTLQRYGMPLLILNLPATADAQMQDEALEAAQQLQLDGVAILPGGISYQKEDPPQWHGLSFEAAIHFHESQIIRRLLLALHSQGGTGQTYVTGDGLLMQARSTSYLLARLSRHLCESFTDEVIRPLVFANYGRNPDLVPQLMLPPPGETNLPDVAQPLAALVSAGIVTRQQAAHFAGFEYAEETPDASEKTFPAVSGRARNRRSVDNERGLERGERTVSRRTARKWRWEFVLSRLSRDKGRTSWQTTTIRMAARRTETASACSLATTGERTAQVLPDGSSATRNWTIF